MFIFKIIAWGNEPTINVGQAAQGAHYPTCKNLCSFFQIQTTTMVPNYKRKTNKASYSSSDLEKALNEINGGKSVKLTSRTYRISCKTLRRHRDGKVKRPGCVCLGRYKLALDPNIELELLKHIKDMEWRMFGLGTTDIRRFVNDVAQNLNIPHPFSTEKNMAGKDWLRSFNRRHHLSVRTPQATSMTRIVGFNKAKVNQFFTIYKDLLETFSFNPSAMKPA